MPRLWQHTAKQNHVRIKRFYLGMNRTEQQWRAVSQDPCKFNRVWRIMLQLPASELPPPKEYRS